MGIYILTIMGVAKLLIKVVSVPDPLPVRGSGTETNVKAAGTPTVLVCSQDGTITRNKTRSIILESLRD